MFCYLNGFDAKNGSTSSQKWLIFVLLVWLLFSIARQTFDLIGKLWVPVAFNLLQVFFYFICQLILALRVCFFYLNYFLWISFWYWRYMVLAYLQNNIIFSARRRFKFFKELFLSKFLIKFLYLISKIFYFLF